MQSYDTTHVDIFGSCRLILFFLVRQFAFIPLKTQLGHSKIPKLAPADLALPPLSAFTDAFGTPLLIRHWNDLTSVLPCSSPNCFGEIFTRGIWNAVAQSRVEVETLTLVLDGSTSRGSNATWKRLSLRGLKQLHIGGSDHDPNRTLFDDLISVLRNPTLLQDLSIGQIAYLSLSTMIPRMAIQPSLHTLSFYGAVFGDFIWFKNMIEKLPSLHTVIFEACIVFSYTPGLVWHDLFTLLRDKRFDGHVSLLRCNSRFDVGYSFEYQACADDSSRDDARAYILREASWSARLDDELRIERCTDYTLGSPRRNLNSGGYWHSR